MRSIGAWNIKRLKRIVEQEVNPKHWLFTPNLNQIRENIYSRIPEDWYNSWECAYSEINNLVEEFIDQANERR